MGLRFQPAAGEVAPSAGPLPASSAEILPVDPDDEEGQGGEKPAQPGRVSISPSARVISFGWAGRRRRVCAHPGDNGDLHADHPELARVESGVETPIRALTSLALSRGCVVVSALPHREP